MLWINSLNKIKHLAFKKHYYFMDVKNCYAIFHIDFGSTFVWFHILHWKKLLKERKHNTEDCLPGEETERSQMFSAKEKLLL